MGTNQHNVAEGIETYSQVPSTPGSSKQAYQATGTTVHRRGNNDPTRLPIFLSMRSLKKHAQPICGDSFVTTNKLPQTLQRGSPVYKMQMGSGRLKKVPAIKSTSSNKNCQKESTI